MVLLRRLLTMAAVALLGLAFTTLTPSTAVAENYELTNELCGGANNEYGSPFWATCDGDWCAEYPHRPNWPNVSWKGKRGHEYYALACDGGNAAAVGCCDPCATTATVVSFDECGRVVVKKRFVANPCCVPPRRVIADFEPGKSMIEQDDDDSPPPPKKDDHDHDCGCHHDDHGGDDHGGDHGGDYGGDSGDDGDPSDDPVE